MGPVDHDSGRESCLSPHRLSYPNDTRSVSSARHAVQALLAEWDLETLSGTVPLVVSELVANAVLHTDGPVEVQVDPIDGGGVRISVFDTSPILPVVPTASVSSMTGRGLLLVRSLASGLGFSPDGNGKMVWAEVIHEPVPSAADVGTLIDAWADDLGDSSADDPGRHPVELGDVPTDLLLAAKSHVDNLCREFVLAAAGARAGSTAAVPPHLAQLIETVVHRFAEARLSIKRQALDAYRRGQARTRLRLDLPPEAADAAVEYLQALDEADAYCRAARLLTLETPAKHRVFRHWYIGELVRQLRQAQAGEPTAPPQPFEQRLLDEIDAVATAWALADRAARLYNLSSALSSAMTPEEVAEGVLTEGVAALGASGGGMMLPGGGNRLRVPGTIGYDETVVASLRSEPATAELPAAAAMRTGEAVWLESREERDSRFPELGGMERNTVSMCAVPLEAGGRLLGALRFSFSEARLFDPEERRFVMALAAQAAQTLDRVRLHQERVDISLRLQRSLLPPALPDVPGVSLAALYHPLGDGVEIGGDFYDVWATGNGEWAFAIGDVCGTGPEAAAMTALVRHTLQAISRVDTDQAAILNHLNEILLSAGHGDDRFCTLILGSIATGTAGTGGRRRAGGSTVVRLATGGHPGPVVRRGDATLSLVETGGSLLGVLPSVDLVESEVVLRDGDSLIFYTDGVTEARSGRSMFGTEGLLASLGGAPREAAGMAAALEADVLAYSNGVLSDDMAVLVIQSLGGDRGAGRS